MNKDEVLHLAELAKLDLNEEEISLFPSQLQSILEFVGTIKDVEISGDSPASARDFSHYNIFRKDENPHAEGEHRAAIMHEMPETKDEMLKVKKILNN